MTGCLFSLVTAFILASRPLRMSAAVSSLSLCLLYAGCAPLYIHTGGSVTQWLGAQLLRCKLGEHLSPQVSRITSGKLFNLSGPVSCKM